MTDHIEGPTRGEVITVGFALVFGVAAAVEGFVIWASGTSNSHLRATGTALSGQVTGVGEAAANCDAIQVALRQQINDLNGAVVSWKDSSDKWGVRALTAEAGLAGTSGVTPESTFTPSATATFTRTPEGQVCVTIPTKTKTPTPSRTSTVTVMPTPSATRPLAFRTPTDMPRLTDTPRPADTQVPPTDTPRPRDTDTSVPPPSDTPRPQDTPTSPNPTPRPTNSDVIPTATQSTP